MKIILTVFLIIYILSIYPSYYLAEKTFFFVFFDLLDESKYTDEQIRIVRNDAKFNIVLVSFIPLMNTLLLIPFIKYSVSDICSYFRGRLRFCVDDMVEERLNKKVNNNKLHGE